MVRNQYQTLLHINDKQCIFVAWNSCSQRWDIPFEENHSSSGWDARDMPVSGPAIRAPGRIQPIFNISLTNTENAWCNQMLRATYVSFALFIIWNKVIQCVQWGRWWSLTELFLHLPKWGLNGKHGASRILLYVKASVKRRWLMKRDVHLPQIGRFQFSNTDFHIHYWTQAFSFDCYYTCLIFTLQLVWIFTWSLSVAVLCSYCGVRVLHLWDKIYKCIASVCSHLQK